MIATLAVPDNSSYSMPTWAIIIAAIWLAIVIVLHAYAFFKTRSMQQAARRSESTQHATSGRPIAQH